MSLPAIKRIDVFDYRRHHQMEAGHDVAQIAKPLEKYGITYFGYSSVNANREETFLTSRTDTSRVYYEGKYYEKLFSDDFTKYCSANLLWRDISASDENAANLFNDFSEIYNVANGLYMVRRREDRVDNYVFGAAKQDEWMNAFYFSNLDLFESFIDYFHDVAAGLIDAAHQNRVYIPNCQDNTLLTSGRVTQLNSAKNLSKLTYLCEFYQLTAREVQCVNLLIEGMQHKNIAATLGLSPRTVEKFIANIKLKTASKTLLQAVSKLLSIN